MQPGPKADLEFKRVLPEQGRLLVDWMKRYYTYDHIPFHEEKITLGLPALLNGNEQGQAFFITQKNETIGYFIFTFAFDLEFGGRYGTVTDLFLTETSRRAGLGTQILAFVDSLCEKENISTLILQVEIDNLKAQGFYQKSGFQKLNRFLLAREVGPSGPQQKP